MKPLPVREQTPNIPDGQRHPAGHDPGLHRKQRARHAPDQPTRVRESADKESLAKGGWRERLDPTPGRQITHYARQKPAEGPLA